MYREGKVMKEKKYTIFSNWNRVSTLSAAILAFFLLAGCVTGGNYGKFDRDRDLDNMFLNYEVLPDHRYYTSGGYDAPDAILAIHSDYELEDAASLWVPIPNVDYAQMRKWIDTIAPEQNYRYSNGYFAAYILDLNGKRVGAWYSIASYTPVKFLEGNKIQVYTPDLDRIHGKGLRRGRL
jgi:hypothetical protein